MNSAYWRCIFLFSVLGLLPIRDWAQTQSADVPPTGSGQSLTPVTLWMTWQRGDARYPNFIRLSTPCQDSEDGICECSMSFKIVNSSEFADYISSFGSNKVPVTYEVAYDSNGRPGSKRLASVGTWPSDKFPTNDRLLAVSIEPKSLGPGHSQQFKMRGSADCFPFAGVKETSIISNSAETKTNHLPDSKQQNAVLGDVNQPVRVPAAAARELLIKRVEPDYPQVAREKRIQGAVILKIKIRAAGDVADVAVISGHPLLAPAAVDAVRQWKYKPYFQNGAPVTAETQVQVDFRLHND